MEVAGLCGLCGKPSKKLFTCKLCGRTGCEQCIELDVCRACATGRKAGKIGRP